MAIHRFDLTTEELGTISLALAAWVVRCSREAQRMDDLAAPYENAGALYAEQAQRCRANANASRAFLADATALQAKLKG